MTAPQMTALSAFCFIAVVLLVASLISCKGNKNHYLVNISHCVGYPNLREREQDSSDMILGGGREAEEERV